MPTSVGRNARRRPGAVGGALRAVEAQQLAPQPLRHDDGGVGGGVRAPGDSRLHLAEGDLVGDEHRRLQAGTARLGDVVGRGRRRQARPQHRLTGEVEVAAVLDDGAGDDLARAAPRPGRAGRRAPRGPTSACPGSRPRRTGRTGARRGSGCRRGRRRGGLWSPVWLLGLAGTGDAGDGVPGTEGNRYWWFLLPSRLWERRRRHRTGAARAGTSTASPAARSSSRRPCVPSAATAPASGWTRSRPPHARRRRSSTATSPTGRGCTPPSPSGSTRRSSVTCPGPPPTRHPPTGGPWSERSSPRT